MLTLAGALVSAIEKAMDDPDELTVERVLSSVATALGCRTDGCTCPGA
jgi:hypothetical protein